MKNTILVFACIFLVGSCMAQKTFLIGSENISNTEKRNRNAQTDTISNSNDPLLFNVSEPMLMYFPADPAVRNGLSVIICPGGGFYYLHIKTEGIDVAKWLNSKGISAFVLQYRLVHCETGFPMKERDEKRKDTPGFIKLVAPVIPLSIADAKQSIAYVRRHAKEWGLSPDKIGILGFSAGGTLAVASALDFNSENRPYFIAPIYPYVPPFLSMNIVKETPPLFIAAASDDEYHLVPTSINLYNKWLTAGRPAELHIYSKGGHGFGMNKQAQPSDTWVERFDDWLRGEGL
jgi:acetyl esterase/lipase